jgi:phenylpyruvate tautomerase PptA (4-oxalocrotonate tautomerase family)
MPLYTCITTTKTLADDTKAALAAEITKIHSSITGAPTSFVHVIFHELPATNVFTDASPSRPLLITGVIRAGRADGDKVRLATDISSRSSRIAGIPEARIRVNIADRPARFVVEGGRVMPEPGAEDDWLAETTSWSAESGSHDDPSPSQLL